MSQTLHWPCIFGAAILGALTFLIGRARQK